MTGLRHLRENWATSDSGRWYKPRMFEHRITEDEAGQRLDKLARRLLPEVPLSGVYKLIRTRRIRVNGKRAQPGQILEAGDVVEFRVVREEGEAERPRPRPRQLPDVPILYEDDAILVVDKPGGMAVHPGSGIQSGTLLDWVRTYLEVDESTRGFKPSPAHRLDRETSGVIVVAKKRRAMVALTETFAADRADKRYLALVKGRMARPAGTIDIPLAEHQQTARSRAERGINFQEAITHYRVLAMGKGVSLLECRIETGRTHQIRRHLAAIGRPVVGDRKYGDFPFNRQARKDFGLSRQFLHARSLALPHPVSGEPMRFEAPLPDDLVEVLRRAGISWTPRKS